MARTARKSFSRLLTAALFVAVILVMAVAASAADYDLWVDGTRVTSDNASDILGNGTAVYSASENVLYLDGATLSEVALWRGTEEDPEWNQYHAAIGSKIPGLTIDLSGDNTIYVDGSYYDGIDTDYNCDLTITGPGSLSIKAPGGYGMYISGWDVEPTTGSLTITGGASVRVESAMTGIWVHQNIDFNNCSVDILKEGDAYFGIVCNTGVITVTDSDIRVETVRAAIELGNGETHDLGFIINSGNVELVVNGTTDDDKAISAFPLELATITVNGGTLSITSVTGGTIIPDENITIADGLEFTEGSSLKDTGHVVLTEPATAPDEERTVVIDVTDAQLREKASDFLRKALRDRVPTITIEIKGQFSDFNGGDVQTWFNNWIGTEEYNIWKLAYEHTGVPNEGDYLVYHMAGHGTSYDGGGTYEDYRLTSTYTVSYYTTYEQERIVETQIRNILDSLDIEGKSDYVKVREIYNWICANISYDRDNLNNPDYKLKHSAYAALVNRKAVCQGYANLFYRMALTEGIDARIISGKGNSGNGWEDHGWNIVKLGNLYYNLDSTWDATMLSTSGTYRFFLKGNAQNDFTTRHVRQPFVLDYNTGLTLDNTSAEFNARHPMDPNDFVVKYEVGVSTDDEEQGTVEIVGYGNGYEYGEDRLGTTVVIKATAEPGYVFREWKLNGTTYSSDPQITVTLGENDMDFEAVFEVYQAPAFITGDIDLNGNVEIADVILLLQHSIFPDLYPLTYPGSVDFNSDGTLNVSDVVMLLQHTIFPDLYPIN